MGRHMVMPTPTAAPLIAATIGFRQLKIASVIESLASLVAQAGKAGPFEELLDLAAAQPQSQQFPAMPMGAGNRTQQGRHFFAEPDGSPLTEGAGESLAILPE